MGWSAGLLGSIGVVLFTAGFNIALLWLTELAAPQDRLPIATRLRGWFFWMLAIPVSVVVALSLGSIWRSFGIDPLLKIPVDGWLKGWGWAALVVGPLVAAAINDFFFYWFHRAQHTFLWRFHAVHHSIRDLHGGSGYHHLSEPLFRFFLMTIPASFVTTDVRALALVAGILGLQQAYVHSSTSACLGWGRVLLVDNRFHRIHHSLDERHFDKNFGAMTTLWDRLFGTAYWPAKDEWPAVGLAEIDEPRTVREFIDLPLRFGRRKPEAVPAE